ncbi:fibronectin type III domain-containing protein [Bacillus cytotoxicus]|uniref:fibronectin type III domain-containing protein n=1 Tax=Bacillus cytotoxicus TaxID=580165 RepID=UPI001FEEA833|nr:fibronectin type III domain-containing protein [Bacillus cytotoxicus]
MRCKYILSVVLVCFFSLMTFHVDVSAETFDVLKGKEGYIKKNPKIKIVEMTDGDSKTSKSIFSADDSPVVFDLGKEYDVTGFSINAYARGGYGHLEVSYLDSDFKVLKNYKKIAKNEEVVKKVRYVTISYVHTNEIRIFDFNVFADDGRVGEVTNVSAISNVNEITLNWQNPPQEKFAGVNIYKENELIAKVDKPVNSYVVEGLKDDTSYVFSLRSFNDDGIENPGVMKTFRTLNDPKKIPPGPVSSLVAESTDKTVKLHWKSPKDDDLAGFKVFLNGKKYAEIGLQEEFIIKNLNQETEYNVSVVAVDKDKNDSSPVNLSVKTLEEKDEEPPHAPSNVFAKPSNGALIASWDRVSDKDLAGYNVYLDGKKMNSNLITSTSFVLKNLENGTKYKVQVNAVDRSGNISELSVPVYGVPDPNTIPVIESKYNLQDISDGVSVMFSNLWLCLAYSVGISLAFYIIYKLKHLILP